MTQPLQADPIWFLDDLRPTASGLMSPQDMVDKSILQLVKEGKLDLWAKVKQVHRAGLQRLRVPHPDREVDVKKQYHLYPHRMQTMQTLIGNEHFRKKVTMLMKSVLEQPKFQETSPPLQERIALQPGRVSGSLRECYLQAIDEIIVALTAKVFSKMERNFGLSVLANAIKNKHSAAETLWWMMTEASDTSLKQLEPDAVVDGLRMEVANDGPKVFISRYPSSWAMVNFFEEGSRKETLIKRHGSGIAVSVETAAEITTQLMQMHSNIFGKDVAQAVIEYVFVSSGLFGIWLYTHMLYL